MLSLADIAVLPPTFAGNQSPVGQWDGLLPPIGINVPD